MSVKSKTALPEENFNVNGNNSIRGPDIEQDYETLLSIIGKTN